MPARDWPLRKERSRRLPPASLPGKRNLRSPNLRSAPATEQLRAVQARASSQEAELERLRGEVRQSQHELDMANKQLELACKENELLAKIHQGDLARRERELAIEKRGKTDAELASQMTIFEAGEAGAVANATM